MRVLTFAIRALAAIFGLCAVCIGLAAAFFNPNAYRTEVETWVTQQTGRSFTLDGELGWRLWPRLALTLPHTRLGQGPGFAESEFVQWQQASVAISIKSLLTGRLQFGELELRGLRVALQRDAQGRENWRDLLQLLNSDQPSRWQFQSAAGLRLTDAELRFDDQTTQRSTHLQVAQLQTSAVRFDQPVALKVVARLRTQLGVQSVELPFELAAQLQADKALQQVQLAALQATGQLSSTGLLSMTTQALPLSFALREFVWQATPQQVQAQSLRLNIGSAQATGHGSVQHVATHPEFDTSWQLSVPDLRQWLQTLGIHLPATHDASVLQKLQMTLRMAGNADQLRIQLPSLQLDQTQFTGSGTLRLSDAHARYAVELHADQLNLDRYLPMAAVAKTGATAAPLPVAWLRSLSAQGTLQIERAQWQGIRAQRLQIELDGE